MTPWTPMQLDFVASASTAFWSAALCFSSAVTRLSSPATRGSFAEDVPCAIGTTIATNASTKRSHGSFACLISHPSCLEMRVQSRVTTRFWTDCQGAVLAAAADPPHVVRQADEEERQDEREADHRDPL